MKVIILTSSLYGTAAHHLPFILESKTCEVVAVIYNKGYVSNKRRYYLRKLKKTLRIGLAGALNGIRMRRWFDVESQSYLSIRRLDEICQEHAIPLHHVAMINSESTRMLFSAADVDIGISLGNSYIAKCVFSIPKLGMINLHHEKLPEYQNAQPILWQLYHSSRNTAFTIHRIDSKIDTGEILFSQDVPIKFERTLAETVAHTYAQLLMQSAAGLVHVLQNFEILNANSKPQGMGRSYTTPTLLQYLRMYRNYRKLRNS